MVLFLKKSTFSFFLSLISCSLIGLLFFGIFSLFNANNKKNAQNASEEKERTNMVIIYILLIVQKSLIYLLLLCHRASLWYKNYFKKNHWATRLHWLTCSLITINTHTEGYSDPVPHTQSCCPKHSLAYQIWIIPSLKITPNECTISSKN